MAHHAGKPRSLRPSPFALMSGRDRQRCLRSSARSPKRCALGRRTTIRVSTAIVLMTCAMSGLRAQESQLRRVAWLAGCWAAENEEQGSGEHWLPLAGGTMLGVARTVRNGETVEHEFLQIRENADGEVIYIASPSRQQETTFVATNVAEDAVTFENPEHDFPQRIVYRALPESRLVVRIEGALEGTQRAVDFPMKRVRCEDESSR
jgi:hypothetical protein